jgi:hypothetical protein
MDGKDSVSVALQRLTTLITQIRSEHDQLGDGPDPAPASTARDSAREDMAARVLDGLVLLREVLGELATWEPELIAAARRAGTSWAQLAPALGVASRQAAERRYLRLHSTGGGHEVTKEARVQATRDRRAGDRAVAAWARQNSATLRQLAGQASAVRGLGIAGQREVARVRAELAGDDPTTLLDPLSALRTHLVEEHPALAAQLADVTADAEQRRHRTMSDRHSTRAD